MKIFVNPTHGNAPFIIGTHVALQVALELGKEVEIVVPHINGKRQEIILKDLGLDGIVKLDQGLKEFYDPLLMKAYGFEEHVSSLLSFRKLAEENIKRYLDQNYGGFDLEINYGAKIVTEAEKSYYAFPAIFSEILMRSADNKFLSNVFNERKLRACSFMMKEVEEKFEFMFIPDYHTFSYLERENFEREIKTPPQQPLARGFDGEILENSMYFMLSGTGSDIDSILEKAREFRSEGFNPIIPSWYETDEFQKMSPKVISHPNVVQLYGRAGFGFIWDAQQVGKKVIHHPYGHGDDAEIYHNIKTLESLDMLEATEKMREKFSDMDGIKYIASRIVADLRA
ncbi:hypothetical protein HN681_00575 [archaeon]|jgi:hypothetical protein|nr:hypothetical protein [archaeon]MBT3730720.1 hypothetical protein [archaeon]MBT4669622.1 hypothetical protein [archaeon]MBT5030379.1 hypothetical protein [archaeon]MBT5288328.1 hypothetical protein [archaeon]